MGLLAAIVGDSAESELAQEALSALGSVGDARAVPLLEPEIWDIRWPDLQLKAIELGVAFAGEDGNTFLLRLMRSAPSDAQFIPLIGLLRTSELPTALESFQVASRESQPVRLAAALHIDRFRGPEFTAFIDAWAAVDRRLPTLVHETMHNIDNGFNPTVMALYAAAKSTPAKRWDSYPFGLGVPAEYMASGTEWVLLDQRFDAKENKRARLRRMDPAFYCYLVTEFIPKVLFAPNVRYSGR